MSRPPKGQSGVFIAMNVGGRKKKDYSLVSFVGCVNSWDEIVFLTLVDNGLFRFGGCATSRRNHLLRLGGSAFGCVGSRVTKCADSTGAALFKSPLHFRDDGAFYPDRERGYVKINQRIDTRLSCNGLLDDGFRSFDYQRCFLGLKCGL